MAEVLFAFVLGCCLGSFAAATVHVWCHDRPFWRRRSRCPLCGHMLAPWELVPLLSYCLLGGRCAACRQRISPVYPLVELACGLCAALLVRQEGLTAIALVHVLLATLLVSAALCDIRTGLLPDVLTLGGLVLFVPLLILLGDIDAADALLGMALGAGLPLLLRQIFLVVRHKDVLGLGDIKLLALMGGVCGWQAVPCLLLLSALGGLVAFACLSLARRHRQDFSPWTARLPYGPFLCAATCAVLLVPDLPFRLALLLAP